MQSSGLLNQTQEYNMIVIFTRPRLAQRALLDAARTLLSLSGASTCTVTAYVNGEVYRQALETTLQELADLLYSVYKHEDVFVSSFIQDIGVEILVRKISPYLIRIDFYTEDHTLKHTLEELLQRTREVLRLGSVLEMHIGVDDALSPTMRFLSGYLNCDRIARDVMSWTQIAERLTVELRQTHIFYKLAKTLLRRALSRLVTSVLGRLELDTDLYLDRTDFIIAVAKSVDSYYRKFFSKLVEISDNLLYELLSELRNVDVKRACDVLREAVEKVVRKIETRCG